MKNTPTPEKPVNLENPKNRNQQKRLNTHLAGLYALSCLGLIGFTGLLGFIGFIGLLVYRHTPLILKRKQETHKDWLITLCLQ